MGIALCQQEIAAFRRIEAAATARRTVVTRRQLSLRDMEPRPQVEDAQRWSHSARSQTKSPQASASSAVIDGSASSSRRVVLGVTSVGAAILSATRRHEAAISSSENVGSTVWS